MILTKIWNLNFNQYKNVFLCTQPTTQEQKQLLWVIPRSDWPQIKHIQFIQQNLENRDFPLSWNSILNGINSFRLLFYIKIAQLL